MKSRADLTFKHNIKNGRHGWLRLTPAYSVKLVHDILDQNSDVRNVLDPFSGTATTGLVCAERGIHCDLLEVNPFLVWFGQVKISKYSIEELQQAEKIIDKIVKLCQNGKLNKDWRPPLHNIERWWSPHRITALSKIHESIQKNLPADSPEKNLAWVAFCKILIQWSNAAFNHQSMSFKEVPTTEQLTLLDNGTDPFEEFALAAHAIVKGAHLELKGSAKIIEADSRSVPLPRKKYDCVITSPPYPNRMSYIRELRPYMYWLEFLKEAREAGELDWKAIGGTWGIATSRVAQWQPNGIKVPFKGFNTLVDNVRSKSGVLGNYIHKYFVDIVHHVETLAPCIETGGKVFYIVGNSKFYETLVPVEKIYEETLKEYGFKKTTITTIRKRNSKKELFEFIVSGEKE